MVLAKEQGLSTKTAFVCQPQLFIDVRSSVDLSVGPLPSKGPERNKIAGDEVKLGYPQIATLRRKIRVPR
ncbi:MAG: hypothetical protein GY822_08695 [Deltaproteobacteria bacterium]|nr:hypothetical protein [Deltaproteobacteria bacterium]